MIRNDEEFKVTPQRIGQFQAQLAHLRGAENSPENYRLSAEEFMAEIDRMQLEVREYLMSHLLEAVVS